MKKKNRWEDHFSRQAKKDKYSARSVFKLQEVQKKHRLIKPGDVSLPNVIRLLSKPRHSFRKPAFGWENTPELEQDVRALFGVIDEIPGIDT